MQSLDVISINLLLILISLCNLLILFLILKKFLYKPVRRVISERNKELENSYSKAEEAKKQADLYRSEWETKMQEASEQADAIQKSAAERANLRYEQILSDAKEKAGSIVKDAQIQAESEYKNAMAEIKKEIVDVSAVLAEKMLDREINTEDHHAIIDSVIADIGDAND